MDFQKMSCPHYAPRKKPIPLDPIGRQRTCISSGTHSAETDRMTIHGFRAIVQTIMDEVLGFRADDGLNHGPAVAIGEP